MKRNNPGSSKIVRRLLGVLVCAAIALVIGISGWMAITADSRIAAEITTPTEQLTAEEEDALKAIDPDCILVLGAGVYGDGTPTPMLRDRLDTGIALYREGIAPKLLLSGDNGQVEYNEVDAMLRYATEMGVPEEDIFLDHAGFSTYDSIYRANYIFGVKKAIVVTQTYHLFRALYGCEKMGIKALGVGSDQDSYVGSKMRELREVLARDKDWVKWIIKPEPTFLGEEIPISGDGRDTQ